MTFDPTKPVQRRDGKPARIICTNRKSDRPIVALHWEDGQQCEHAYYHKRDGTLGGLPNDFDLINIPRKFTKAFWVGIDEGGRLWCHPEKQTGNILAGLIALKQITVDITEGEGL